MPLQDFVSILTNNFQCIAGASTIPQSRQISSNAFFCLKQKLNNYMKERQHRSHYRCPRSLYAYVLSIVIINIYTHTQYRVATPPQFPPNAKPELPWCPDTGTLGLRYFRGLQLRYTV